MIDDKDVRKLIKAFGEVFPTAKMVNDSFNAVATKDQVREVIKEELVAVKVKLDSIGDLRPRVNKIEEILGID